MTKPMTEPLREEIEKAMQPNTSDSNGNRLPSFVVDSNGCWIWTRTLTPSGYATDARTTSGKRVRYRVHRQMWEDFNGPVPEGLELDHLCRVRCCVNPAHIEAVTHRENVLRGVSPIASNLNKTHCPNGHEYNAANTRYRKQGRQCRVCNRTQKRLAYARQYGH